MTHGHPDRREANHFSRKARRERAARLKAWLALGILAAAAAVIVSLAGCEGPRAPDGYGVQIEASRAEGVYGRGEYASDRLAIAPYVEWDSGERRAARLEERDFRADAVQEILELRHELALSRAAGGAVPRPGSTGSSGSESGSGGQGGDDGAPSGLVGRVLAGEVSELDIHRLAVWAIALALLGVVAALLRSLGVPIPWLGKRAASAPEPSQDDSGGDGVAGD